MTGPRSLSVLQKLHHRVHFPAAVVRLALALPVLPCEGHVAYLLLRAEGAMQIAVDSRKMDIRHLLLGRPPQSRVPVADLGALLVTFLALERPRRNEEHDPH